MERLKRGKGGGGAGAGGMVAITSKSRVRGVQVFRDNSAARAQWENKTPKTNLGSKQEGEKCPREFYPLQMNR